MTHETDEQLMRRISEEEGESMDCLDSDEVTKVLRIYDRFRAEKMKQLAGKSFVEMLCQHGEISWQAEQGFAAGWELIGKWEERAKDALPADAMLINLHIRELRAMLSAAPTAPSEKKGEGE